MVYQSGCKSAAETRQTNTLPFQGHADSDQRPHIFWLNAVRLMVSISLTLTVGFGQNIAEHYPGGTTYRV